MNPNNLNYTLEITVNDQKKNSAYQELQALADNSEYLVTGSYEEQLQKWEKNMRLMSVCVMHSDYSGWNWNHESCEHYDEQYLLQEGGSLEWIQAIGMSENS